ncbi:serine/arginine repetitive matrix protein 4 [Aulostomus maculatus]
MQPPCSLQLDPCGSSLSLGSQGSSASLQQKQLFEKFWKGTFKAVATPRPESVIVASITARRRVTDSETTACQSLKIDERKEVDADTRVHTAESNGYIRGKVRKHHSHRRVRSPSFDEELQPKGKKKKRKSERKRKRRRSPSHSLSPLRKKKKKKKKNTKKSKRHRYISKKSKRSSSSLKHKRKDERKHKKSASTSSPHTKPIHCLRTRRGRQSLQNALMWGFEVPGPTHVGNDIIGGQRQTVLAADLAQRTVFAVVRKLPQKLKFRIFLNRHTLQKSVVHQTFGDLTTVREESNGLLDHSEMKWRPATKSVCKTAPKYRSILSTGTILSSKPGSELLAKGSQHLSSQTHGPHDYDSGNDTSSPPSSKTGVSRASVIDEKRDVCHRLPSPEKLRLTDTVSDSGNSVTSYTSVCKPYREDGLSATIFSGNGKSSRYSGHHSRSPSPSSGSTYSRSSSYSADERRAGSVTSMSSRGSYSRYSADRLRARKRTPSSRETDVKHKVIRKRRRRKSYSPMKKRRRDSPSHLEARRITSARKRPIPYFRPSPSSSSRSTSVSSWSSLFTRSRSRSPIHSFSRSLSRSRSRSYSSYRSYSRSSSWNSIFGTRSRSQSHNSLNKRKKRSRGEATSLLEDIQFTLSSETTGD